MQGGTSRQFITLENALVILRYENINHRYLCERNALLPQKASTDQSNPSICWFYNLNDGCNHERRKQCENIGSDLFGKLSSSLRNIHSIFQFWPSFSMEVLLILLIIDRKSFAGHFTGKQLPLLSIIWMSESASMAFTQVTVWVANFFAAFGYTLNYSPLLFTTLYYSLLLSTTLHYSPQQDEDVRSTHRRRGGENIFSRFPIKSVIAGKSSFVES
jgi:hypothetical protein